MRVLYIKQGNGRKKIPPYNKFKNESQKHRINNIFVYLHSAYEVLCYPNQRKDLC